jgi:hypothetical protein
MRGPIDIPLPSRTAAAARGKDAILAPVVCTKDPVREINEMIKKKSVHQSK